MARVVVVVVVTFPVEEIVLQWMKDCDWYWRVGQSSGMSWDHRMGDGDIHEQ